MLILLDFSSVRYKNVFVEIGGKYDFDVIESPKLIFSLLGFLRLIIGVYPYSRNDFPTDLTLSFYRDKICA